MRDEDLQILSVGAFFRDDEPGGIAGGLQWQDPQRGLALCEQLQDGLVAFDVAAATPADHVSALRTLSPRRHSLTDIDVHYLIMAVYWLQCRGHLVPDEYNGTVFICMYKGALVQSERNPLTMDLDAEMVGPNAVDVTDIVKASQHTLDLGVPAVRATVEHLRGGRRG
jgi:hypothetical protein